VYHPDVPACVAHMTKGAGQFVAKTAERAVEFYEALLYRHFTVTIALNNGVLPRLRRMGVHRTELLPCGVDLGTFRPEREDSNFKRRHGIGAGQKIILYAGRLSAEKEIDVLLAAHQQLPAGQFALLIAGDGPEIDAIRSYAASHTDVTYLGHYDSPAELAEVYASSDILAIPSRYETFGMSALEAIACGLPVVAIGASGTAGFVDPDIGMLSAPGDPGSLAEKIVLVSKWPKAKTRDVSRKFAAKSYSWNSVFDRYFEIYRSLVAANI
jgi:glycosyltransferase involved in cell wall biosynthesis